MSVQTMSYVIENSQHKGSYLLTLLMIANHAHADGTGAYPSIATLAKETRLSPRGVRYCIDRIKASGELLVFPDSGPNGCNLYQIPMRQSLPYAKTTMRQTERTLGQKNAFLEATAIAPESKNHHIEPSPAIAGSISLSPNEETQESEPPEDETPVERALRRHEEAKKRYAKQYPKLAGR